MTKTFITFEPKDSSYISFFSVDQIINSDIKPEKLSLQAQAIYKTHIEKMKAVIVEMETLRLKRFPRQAKSMWSLGDIVVDLVNKLSSINLEIDDLYAHLTRDLKVNRKWLEKVVIIRRYIENVAVIPKDFPWSKCEKGTKKAALFLIQEYHSNQNKNVR